MVEVDRLVPLMVEGARARKLRGRIIASVPTARLMAGAATDEDLEAATDLIRATLETWHDLPMEYLGSGLSLGLTGLALGDRTLVREALPLIEAHPRPFPNVFCPVSRPRILGLTRRRSTSKHRCRSAGMAAASPSGPGPATTTSTS